MAIVARILELMQLRGFSIASLAEKTGLSENQVRNLLREKRRPNPYLATVERLAWALQVSESDILDIYPPLTELLWEMPEMPFDHYQRLRDLPADTRPRTTNELRDYYKWQREFWRPTKNNRIIKKKRRGTTSSQRATVNSRNAAAGSAQG